VKALFGLARGVALTCAATLALYGLMVGLEKLMDRFGEGR
jgi:hypothetical protein